MTKTNLDDREELTYRTRWGRLAAIQSAIIQRSRWRLGLYVFGIYWRPLVAPTGPDPSLPGFSHRMFARGDAEELIACAKRPELGLSETFVRAALGKGDICSATLRNDEIVAFDWSAFSPTEVHEGVFVSFADKDSYGYFSYTLPEFRGNHFSRIFTPIKDRHRIARGCTHTIAYVAVDNRSSIRLSIGQGSSRIGFAGFWKRGPIFVPFRTRGVREHGLYFSLPRN